jgi:membrane-bound serine protease (ClpP class)
LLALSAQAASAAPKIIAVNVDGVVHPITAEIVAGAIAQAKQQNASLVLVRLNTPGGLMDAMDKTIQEMLASPFPSPHMCRPAVDARPPRDSFSSRPAMWP